MDTAEHSFRLERVVLGGQWVVVVVLRGVQDRVEKSAMG